MVFNLFLSEVRDLVGDETHTDEVAETAYAVLHLLAGGGGEALSEQGMTAALCKILRCDSLPSGKLNSLKMQAQGLQTWKRGLVGGAPLADGGGSNSNAKQQREYGRDVLFLFDAPDFLFQERVKHSKTIEVVRHTPPPPPPPSASKQQPSPSSALPTAPQNSGMVAVEGNWLERECIVHNASDMYQSILAVAKSAGSVEALQGQLFDLLGVEGLELMEKVVAQWDNVKKLTGGKAAQPPVQQQQAAGQPPPTSGSMVVNFESDKKGQQRRRKQEMKARAQAQLLETEDKHEPNLEKLKHVMETGDRSLLPVVDTNHYMPAAGGSARMTEHKFVMPDGAVRHDNADYESVWLPPKRPPFRSDDSLVPITEFESWARNAFKGYEKLNRIQSSVFSSAYRSNENLLICAPTGAGKTNIAMIAILRVLGLNRTEDGYLQKDKFKICYVAPMKALAAEMTANFAGRLAYLGVQVRELTGDMQLTRQEIEDTQIIVTTPEKWDVITRKSTDSPLTSMVHLLILDEVHLLNEDRGPVIETLVARTLRQVESTQSMIRIVGLSATLPNYLDVAQFMHVNERTGLHYFDATYRPVPLEQTFVGVKGKGAQKQRDIMTRYCYDAVLKTLRIGKQCMVFVHSRKDTLKSALDLLNLAEEDGTTAEFDVAVRDGKDAEWAKREIAKTRNSDLKRLLPLGFGCHHAGMLRSDRNLVEKMFHMGLIKVLCCTATLAWGVNLPCKQVIIKGTKVYNAEKGDFMQLGMLDVMQIFGRAGRPQFDDEGSAIMITTIEELYRYLALTTHQAPIESQFIHGLADNLNAEIVLGTVTNVQEAVTWLSYTYLYVRMLRNPMVYGVPYEEARMDVNLVQKRTELIVAAAQELDDVRMIRFNNPSFASTSMGQTASHFYIHHETIRTFNEAFEKKGEFKLDRLIRLICSASEFENIMTREEELAELDKLRKMCPLEVTGDPAGDKTVKVNILLQCYIARVGVQAFALVCDTNFIAQNGARIARGLFEIAVRLNLSKASTELLLLCKMIELRLWHKLSPLRQFEHLKESLVHKLEERGLTPERLVEMDPGEIGAITRVPAATAGILAALEQIPWMEVESSVQPITRTIVRIKVVLKATFRWNDRLHGQVQPFWLFLVNPIKDPGESEESIVHSEYVLLTKKQHRQPIEIVFTTPISHPVPAQYALQICSDRWMGSDNEEPLSFKHLILPQLYPPHTTLLDLQPLPVRALQNPAFEKLFSYEYFNPIQTQVFHTLYHTDQNVLLGAPTGSGKTVAAELAVLRLQRETPHLKAVYLGPLKALVQERLTDWDRKFVRTLGKKMVELTGEFTPDVLALKEADIICTTPEKWDGVSRSWHNRGYVKQVGLIIIDEIHLLGEDRGPILEVIVSRMRYISSQTDTPVRVVGLSTALANAKDLADWLGITGPGLFNFHPSVRPVPLKIHVQGYEGKSYCPRMAKMNRPCYAAICEYSPLKPALIFVSSRRQTRLTAVDIISHVAADGNPKRFVMGSEDALRSALAKVRDSTLKHTLSFGIGLHHAGLPREDRALVELLFGSCVIQVLISTATLAWGVNLPAHLVIVKGCEYFDAKTHHYVDYAITDILQMMGRAGRPQFDDSGEAVIMCTTAMKNFYKKFLYEPFPVESSLADVLHNHLNAEIVSGTITTRHDAVDYLTWTYLFRRILVNPTYYGLENSDLATVNKWLSQLVDEALRDLAESQCIELDEEDRSSIYPLTMGQIISYYYLHHLTARLFYTRLDEHTTLPKLLQVLCMATEYAELPVRHNEDGLNEEMAADPGIRWELQSRDWEDPGVKANLLLQAHFSRLVPPITDYVTDQKSVLDQAVRILQAMVDVAADGGWLLTTLRCMHLMQMVVQGQWLDQSSFAQLPYMDGPEQYRVMKEHGFSCLPQLLNAPVQARTRCVEEALKRRKDRVQAVLSVCNRMPIVDMDCHYVAGGGGVEVKLRRTTRAEGNAYTPLFPKQKREGWWIVCGDASDGELLALKRITITNQLTVKLEIEENGDNDDDDDDDGLYGGGGGGGGAKSNRDLWVYLISDSYIGLDMQMPVLKGGGAAAAAVVE